MISPTIEDYLKAIFKLQKGKEKVTTSSIAERLQLSNATVTSMIKKLAKQKLVKHVSYHGVVLTEGGEKIAVKVIRRHRLVELFLKEILELEWDKVHDEAEQLEHYISDEIMDSIDRVLGYPKADPHGDPIPTRSGDIEKVEDNYTLAEAEVGKKLVINSVSDGDPNKLRFMFKLGLLPGVSISIKNKTPFEGDLDIKVGSSHYHIPLAVAKKIYVTQIERRLKEEEKKHLTV
ncbi:metal-dependent transcriptional regulator [Desulfobacterota bacterium AH_259_B03_O07]|nr:metal-dependent transcriptional regulator [Desulfobacterota bacterium AH_259_B03_O07]